MILARLLARYGATMLLTGYLVALVICGAL